VLCAKKKKDGKRKGLIYWCSESEAHLCMDDCL
jgi:hypothetical protein